MFLAGHTSILEMIMKHQVLILIPEKLGSILLKTLRGPAAKAGNSSAVTRNQSNIGFRFFKCAKQDFQSINGSHSSGWDAKVVVSVRTSTSYFVFFFKKVHPTYIIYKSKKQLHLWRINFTWKTQNITMYKWKRLKFFIGLDWNMGMMVFGQFTHFTLKIRKLLFLNKFRCKIFKYEEFGCPNPWYHNSISFSWDKNVLTWVVSDKHPQTARPFSK